MIFISTILFCAYAVITTVGELTVIGNQHRFADANDDIKLSCKQNTDSNITWTSNTELPIALEAISYSDETKISTLTIASNEDPSKQIGKYSCHSDGEELVFSVSDFILRSNPSLIRKEDFNHNVLLSMFSSYSNVTVSWYRDDVALTSEMIDYTVMANDSLLIHNFKYPMLGLYFVKVVLESGTVYNQSYSLESKPIRQSKKELSKNLVQDEVLLLHCDINGYPMPSIKWMKDDEPIVLDKRVSLLDYNNTVKNIFLANGSLRIENIDFADRANYSCIADNGNGYESINVLVRIKDKLAALWPFLGICAEVIILCAIILFYEKMRAKKMHKEDMQEEANIIAAHNSVNKNDEVRQRK